MKHNYQNIIKKTYAKPVIEEVMLDREMSLVMATGTPPGEGPITPPEDDIDGVNFSNQKEISTYKSATMPSSSSPFGGSNPTY